MIFFTGFLIGVVSLIPGISGGTILVLTKKYNLVTEAISNYKQKENIILLLVLITGIILGTITFARIIEFMFYFIPNGTMIIFSGFVLFNIPDLLKEQKEKPQFFWFLIGMIIIWLLTFFSKNTDTIITDYPKLTILFLIYFSLCGAVDGFFTIIPGISGSMMMMILGPYFLYKSFLANLNFTNYYFAIPLICYFLGDIFGFFLGSKFSNFCLKKIPKIFFSIILGMVLMSSLILLPIPSFDILNISIYLLFLTLSYILYKTFNYFI